MAKAESVDGKSGGCTSVSGMRLPFLSSFTPLEAEKYAGVPALEN
jgi:hypothetical protein